jgi:hypothetical protein
VGYSYTLTLLDNATLELIETANMFSILN